MTYTAIGKQVLRDGQHFADANSEEVAAAIVASLEAGQSAGDALVQIAARKWNTMTEGCNAATEAKDLARDVLHRLRPQ